MNAFYNDSIKILILSDYDKKNFFLIKRYLFLSLSLFMKFKVIRVKVPGSFQFWKGRSVKLITLKRVRGTGYILHTDDQLLYLITV